jgi:hypothetical protein
VAAALGLLCPPSDGGGSTSSNGGRAIVPFSVSGNVTFHRLDQADEKYRTFVDADGKYETFIKVIPSWKLAQNRRKTLFPLALGYLPSGRRKFQCFM